MLFSVLDLKSGLYDRPFVAESADDARRMLDVLFRTPEKSFITMYPDDFILYQIGDFDKETGKLTALEHVKVCSISEIAVRYQPKKIDVPNFVEDLELQKV